MQRLKKHPYSYVSVTVIALLMWIKMSWGGKDRKLGERLSKPLWKPQSPPADSLDDPAPLISASYTLSLWVFLEGFTKPLKWCKCSEVFQYPSKYLSAIKVFWKHCETWAIIWVLLPFLSNWQIPSFDCLLFLWIRAISFFLCIEDPPKHLGLCTGCSQPGTSSSKAHLCNFQASQCLLWDGTSFSTSKKGVRNAKMSN